MSVRPSAQPIHTSTQTVTKRELAACAELTGEASDRPFGIAFILALRTVIGSGALPDGAIMLGHRATWNEAPRPGTFRTEMSIAAADAPRTRFQRVVIAYRTVDEADHKLVIEQAQEVLWPTG